MRPSPFSTLNDRSSLSVKFSNIGGYLFRYYSIMIFITQRYKISVIASSSAEHFNGFIRREAVRGGRFRLFSGGCICECYFNSLYLLGLMSSGPGTVEFDTKKMPCPNCGTVGKIFKVSEINEKPVKNTYCCLECKFVFVVEKK